jgi:hypothetical protein
LGRKRFADAAAFLCADLGITPETRDEYRVLAESPEGRQAGDFHRRQPRAEGRRLSDLHGLQSREVLS